MGRRTRICEPGLTYHVYSRCIEKRNMMKFRKRKLMMLIIIKKAQKKYKFKFNAFGLLHNHFHFIIQTVENGPTISTIMQFIKSQYALRYNKATDRTGPLWNERFGDTIITHADDPVYTYNCIIWHIAYNPVRKKYITDPRHYEFSSINSYLNEYNKSFVKITLNDYFLELGSTFKERVEKFLEFEQH